MNNKVMHSVKMTDCHVEWNSVTNVVLYKDATAHRAIRNIGSSIGISKVFFSLIVWRQSFAQFSSRIISLLNIISKGHPQLLQS